jgi:anaerobic magnesium-protoporphyrin IX monomethyl ester cyclase
VIDPVIKKLKNQVLIIFGIPKIRLTTVERNGVPLSATIKRLMGDDALVHISYPGVGPITLATYLNKNGITLEVKDWYFEKVDFANYGIVGISGTHLDLDQLKEIVMSIREVNSNAMIVVGGPITFTYSSDTLFAAIPDVNYIIFNEGEKTFLELVQAINNNLDVSKIAGIGYRRSNKIIITDKRKPLQPDEICSPDWSFVDMSKRLPLLSIETARGCTYNCAYCFEVNFWGKPVRFRNPQSIIEEIKKNYQQLNILTYRIADSCFSAPEKRCTEICDLLISNFTDRGIPLKWSCYARITNLKKALLQKMKLAGCVAVCVGMESGDQKILKSMNKCYSAEQIVNGISSARELGIITHCNIIAGFPGETNETIENTICILNAAMPDTFHCMVLDVAPNTALSQNKALHTLEGDRLEWKHSTMTSDEAMLAISKIMAQVKLSCHLPMGDVVTILLISAGYTSNEVKALFHSIATDIAGEKELHMLNIAFRRYLL